MAKQAKCDHCGKAEALGTFGSVPAGWVEVSAREEGPEGARQFCGWRCVADFAGNAAAVADAAQLAAARKNGAH